MYKHIELNVDVHNIDALAASVLGSHTLPILVPNGNEISENYLACI